MGYSAFPRSGGAANCLTCIVVPPWAPWSLRRKSGNWFPGRHLIHCSIPVTHRCPLLAESSRRGVELRGIRQSKKGLRAHVSLHPVALRQLHK